MSLSANVLSLIFLLYCFAFDSIALPFLRLTLGEFFALIFLFSSCQSSLLTRQPKWVLSALILIAFVLLHHIAGSFLFGLPFTFYKVLRPLLYILVAGSFFIFLDSFRISSKELAVALRIFLFSYSSLSFFQFIFPFLRLPIYNPSFDFQVLTYQPHITGLTVEPSFYGGFLVTFFCLYTYLCYEIDLACLFSVVLALLLSGSRSGIIIIASFLALRIILLSAHRFKHICIANRVRVPRISLRFVSCVCITSGITLAIFFAAQAKLPILPRLSTLLDFSSNNISTIDLSIYQRLESQRIYSLAALKVVSTSDILASFGYGLFRSSDYIPFSSYSESYSLYFDSLLPLNLFSQLFVELGMFSFVLIVMLIASLRHTPTIGIPPLFALIVFSSSCNTLNFAWAYVALALWGYCSKNRFFVSTQ
jgi:hypothetical protein